MMSEAQKKAQQKYRQSEKGKAAQLRYQQSEKGKAVRKRSQQRYQQSEKGKTVHRTGQQRYSRTDKGVVTRGRFYRKTREKELRQEREQIIEQLAQIEEEEKQMSANELTRVKRKLVAQERAKFRLQQRFAAIDWELDVLNPKVEEMERRALGGQVPVFDHQGETS